MGLALPRKTGFMPKILPEKENKGRRTDSIRKLKTQIQSHSARKTRDSGRFLGFVSRRFPRECSGTAFFLMWSWTGAGAGKTARKVQLFSCNLAVCVVS